MNKENKFICAIATAGIFFALFFSVGAGAEKAKEKAVKGEQGEQGDRPRFLVSSPPLPESLPCSKCHNYRYTDKKKRKLELAHTNIVLKHAEEQRWCYDCHDGDKLRLASGELIGYDKSYNLCRQCHGTIFRDWKTGIHGKMTGKWNGEKLQRACITCHDPHQPRFKQLEPEKQPMKPAEIKIN